MHEARQYTKKEKNAVRCSLCSHRCIIADGKHGICGVRQNEGGTLYATTYGLVSAEAVDPIEKKPLFHYLPGTLSYSLGGIGCNFRCEHCQNYQISQADSTSARLFPLSPKEGVARALSNGSASISWTYNEPTIWHEYTLDMGTLARSRGLGTCYVTNGYITEEALRELVPMLAAFRVDIKAFSDDFYRKVCGAHLQPVLDAAALARELGMHIETVTLVIPGPQRHYGGAGGPDPLGDRTPGPPDAHALLRVPPGLPDERSGCDPGRPAREDLYPGKGTRAPVPVPGKRRSSPVREHVLPGLRRAAHRADRIFQPHYGSR